MGTKNCAIIGVAVFLLFASPLLGTSVRAVSLNNVTMQVSGSFTSVTDYGGFLEMSYGDQMPVDEHMESVDPGPTYVDIGHTILDSNLKAGVTTESAATLSYHAPSGTDRPRVEAYSYSDVWDVWDWAWAHGVGEGMIGAWIPASNQTVTVTATYRYGLSLVDAQPGDPLQPPYDQLPEVDMRLQVSMSDMSAGGQEMLWPKGKWLSGTGMEIHRHGDLVGYSDMSINYPNYETTTWQVNVISGHTYLLWCRSETDARTPWLPEPATLSLLGVGGIALLRRRRIG